MESNNSYKRSLTDRVRSEIIGAYRRGQSIDIISRRLNIDKNRITGVIIDYIIDVVDAINEEKE